MSSFEVNYASQYKNTPFYASSSDILSNSFTKASKEREEKGEEKQRKQRACTFVRRGIN